MNILLVRTIDYWLGIPLCFVLTIAGYICRLIFFKKRKSAYRKFLFIELSEMGSAILAYPAMKYIKKKYPGAEIYFMIFEKNRASVDILGEVKRENVLTIREKFLFLFFIDVFKNVIRMNREKIDVVFDLELFSRASAILSFLSGAPLKVGFHKYRMEGLYRGNFFTHKIQYNFQQHLSKTFISFVKVIKDKEKRYPAMEEKVLDSEIECPVYKSSQENFDNIWRKLKEANQEISDKNNLIVLNASAGLLPIRAWPFDNFVRLAEKILSNPNCYIILTGREADKKIAARFSQSLDNKRCIDFTGKTNFFELVDLYNIADILITNDSGPAHFASLTAIKNFVFFGPESPVLYAPLGKNTKVLYSDFPCSPCVTAFNHRNTSCIKNRCLEVISVDEVYALINQELEIKA